MDRSCSSFLYLCGGLHTSISFSLATRFGVTDTITSDRRPQFTSNVWSELCNMLNISHRQTTATILR